MVDKAKSDLPRDLDMDPMVMDIDFSSEVVVCYKHSSFNANTAPTMTISL
ncbi:hypothetical protein N9Y89_01615 [bacterium]|nr:hypothetical protein [bacterium]